MYQDYDAATINILRAEPNVFPQPKLMKGTITAQKSGGVRFLDQGLLLELCPAGNSRLFTFKILVYLRFLYNPSATKLFY